jgi:predicted permease
VRHDFVNAWRAIRRMPFLAAVVVVSIGIGIGAATTVFSCLQALVLRPLPVVADSAAFYFVDPRTENGGYPGASWLEYRDLASELDAFQELLAFRLAPLNVGEAGRSERTYAELVSGNFFSGLGLAPALGRFISPADTAEPGATPVVVISYDYWRTRYDGRRSVIGETIRVNDRPLTIVGVAPEGFQGTVVALQLDLYVPATIAPVIANGSAELTDRTMRGYSVMGRLRRPVTTAQAQDVVTAAMKRLAVAYPQSNATMTADVIAFADAPRGPQRMLANAVEILLGLMLLLLLAVCGNTANLLLARASTRQQEIGVRIALGARPIRVVTLLLIESVSLALAGAAAGAVLAMWGSRALLAVPVIASVPVRLTTTIDGTALAFAIGLGVVSGVLFGLAPALFLARVDPLRALRSGVRTAGRSGFRHLLMATEVALALAVLIVAGLFLRQFGLVRDADPGFRREGVLLATYDLSTGQTNESHNREFATRVIERLRALPGVDAVAIATSVPLDIHGLPMRAFSVEGRARDDAAEDVALANTVTAGYFATLDIPFLAGADFAALADPAAPAQAIVNQAFVQQFLPDMEPLGRRVIVRNRAYVITGVVRTTVYDTFGESPKPIVYFSFRDRPSAQGHIHVRARAGAEGLLGAEVQRIVRDLDPSLPVYDVRTMSQHIERNLFLSRIPARLFAVLGPVLLALAAVGIYSVVAHGVANRRREIGLRLSLGATPGRVVRDLAADTLRVIAVGGLIGWLLAFVVELHVGAGEIDTLVFTGVPALLLVVATIACWLPARRAASVGPMQALRRD